MGSGFHGKLLEVDLNTGAFKDSLIPEAFYRAYLGGSGLAAHLLYDELDPAIDPLDPANPMMVITGLLTGTVVPTACKVSVCGRSPLTGIWGEATGGGHWPTHLRLTGYDGIIFRGRAKGPVYLLLDGAQVALHSADELWGQDTFTVNDRLKERHGRNVHVASIGVAGEKLVRFAGLMLDGRNARSAARSGLGALMGSKNLKAIVVRGSSRLSIFDDQGIKDEVRAKNPFIRKNAAGLRNFGTGGGVEAVEFWGDLPIKNWQLGSWKEGASKICAQTYLPKTLDRHYSCASCPIRCSKRVKLEEGPYAGVRSNVPQYETLAGFGSNLLCDDPDVIMAANEYCNLVGMDTISASGVVAFALEAYERGILNAEDTGGLALDWSKGESIMGLLELIAERRLVGDLLAEGVALAAARLGQNSEEFAIHTKGMEYALHDPRAFTSMAVHYATANRGACHLDGLTYFLGRGIPLEDMGYTAPQDPGSNDGKAQITYDMQNFLEVFNPLGLCKFLFLGRIGPKSIAQWLSRITGWEIDQEELLKLGERLVNLKRMYNVKLGVSRKDDVLPPRLAAQARPDGRSAGQLPHLGKMLHEYYQLRGWDPEGVPTVETLKRLGLEA